MTELGKYIYGLVCIAAICFSALILTPEGMGKKVVFLACAAAMITAALSPLRDMDFKSYSEAMSRLRFDGEKYSSDGAEYSKNLNRLYIQKQCEAYILDKAEELGAELLSVSVEAEWSTEGFFYPVSAEIVHSCSPDQKRKLTLLIESELGIENNMQNWRTGDENR